MGISVKLVIRAIVAVVLGMGGALAWPATDTTTFSVSATIASACDVTATNLSFGTYSASSGSALDGTSTINVFCTSGTTYDVALDTGSGGGTFTTRQMANGSDALNYNLYTNAGRTVVWGDGSGSTGVVSGTGAGLLSANSHTVYGRIPASQDQPVGTYSSTVTVTVTF